MTIISYVHYEKGSEVVRDILVEIKLVKSVHSNELGELLGVEKTASRQAKSAKLHRFLKRLAEDIDLLQKVSSLLKKPVSYFLFSNQTELSEEFENLVLSRLEQIDRHLGAINNQTVSA